MGVPFFGVQDRSSVLTHFKGWLVFGVQDRSSVLTHFKGLLIFEVQERSSASTHFKGYRFLWMHYTVVSTVTN